MATKLESALHVAYKALARRAHFERQIADLLEKEGFLPDTIEQAIDRLRELKLVNDAQMAENYVEGKGHGENRLRMELAQKGASAETIDDLMAAMPADREKEAALKALRHRFATATVKNPFKMGRYLHQRGFDEELIESVVQQYCEE